MICNLGDPMSLCHPVARAPNQELLKVGGVTWLIRTWHDLFINTMTYSYILHHSFICGMTHSHVWHDSPAARAPNKHTEYWRRDSFVRDITDLYVTWLIHMCDMTHTLPARRIERDMTNLYVTWRVRIRHESFHTWHDSFTCVEWLSHMWDMTRSCVPAHAMCHGTHCESCHTERQRHSQIDRAQNQEILNIEGVTWLICTWNDLYINAVTYSYIFHHSFICGMTHSHVWHDSPAARAPSKYLNIGGVTW